MSELRAIVFDFDGVLADTEGLHFRAFRDVLAGEGIELTSADYAARYLGRADSEVFRAVAFDRGLALDSGRIQSLLRRKAVRYEALVETGDVTIPGVAEKVRAWSEMLPLAVASGARRSEIEYVLGAARLLSCFTAVVAAEDVARGKPGPDPYLEVLRRLNEASHGQRGMQPIAATRVVAVEDSLSGLESIRAAGMHSVAVSTNYPASVLSPHAELVVASVADVHLATLQQLVK
ncbi:MAG: HAD family hydrolase [Bacteroidales bacterium]